MSNRLDAESPMRISIIIPVYNEENTLESLLRRINQVSLPNIAKEIIIVDDDSTDDTRKLLQEQTGTDIIKKFHSRNQGKGAAVRTGISFATGDLILIQDGDLEYDPEDYLRLIEPVIRGKASVVYGSRFKNKRPEMSILFYLANRFLTSLTNILYSCSLTDMETGYKLFQRDLLMSLGLESKGFEIEPEITAKLILKGVEIHEVPINYKARSRKMGKKIGFIDGIITVYTLFKFRFQKGRK